jgi:multidrug efflux pump subunit AcrA (membrane-fusion protein)
LPVEVPYVPRRKRAFYVIYGILSGLYGYSLLSFLMVITYHILRSFSPEWAFVPASAIGFWVFRSRTKLLVNFMKMLYLDKKQRVRAAFTPGKLAAFSAALLLILFLPVWPDFVQGVFVLVPAKPVVLRAVVAGTVAAVGVQEGQKVSAGTQLLRMQNLELESQAAQANSNLNIATSRAIQAGLRYTDFGTAEQERQRSLENDRLFSNKLAQLAVVTPISGTVLTPHIADLVGRSVDEGDLLMELADTSQMEAQIYLPEFAMHDLLLGAHVRLLVQGRVAPLSGVLSLISPASAPIAEGLVPKARLQGIDPPRYYLGTVPVKNDSDLMAGMTGSAKVLTGRRSLAGICFRFGRDLIERKVW